MKKFVDQEKTKAENIDVKPNPRFDRERKDVGNALEEDLPIRTIHMIGSTHDPELENRIRGEIHIVKQMNEVFSVQPADKKPRNGSFEPGSITFTKVDLVRVQHPYHDPLVIQM